MSLRANLLLSLGLGLGSTLCGCGGTAPEPRKDSDRPLGFRARVPEDVLRKNGLEELWYFPADAADTPTQLVELAAEGLFLATQVAPDRPGRLKLFSRASGEPLWFYELKHALEAPPSVYRYPAVVTGRPNEVFLTQLSTVHCLDLKYGDELWANDLPFSVSTRVVGGELHCFAGADNGRVYGVRKESGLEEWTYRTGDAIVSSPAVQGTSVYVTSMDGSVYKFFATAPGWLEGSSWSFATGARIVGDPVLFSRWVLVGSTDYKLYCLESQDATVHWAFQAGAPVEDTPVVYSYRSNQEYAYCIAVRRTTRGEDRTLFAVKFQDGSEAWRRNDVRKVVSIGKRSLYTLNDPRPGEGRFLVALDVLTGEEQFRIPIDGFDFVPLNSADSGRNQSERGRIYLIARDGTIQAIGERS